MPRLYEIMDSQYRSNNNEINWAELRKRAQEKIMAEVPPEILGKYRDQEAKNIVRKKLTTMIDLEYSALPFNARQSIIERLVNEIQGYGPIEQFLDNTNITEIIVEKYDKIIIEENGELKETDVKFDNEEHLRLVIERIIAPIGRRLDYSSPMVDARLPDGSRVCAVIPPISPDGATITIRKFRPNVSINDLVRWGMLPEKLKESLAKCVKARLNIIISGGTGSGKTTFLNALSEFIDPRLSIITIENPIEMQLRHPHVRRWEARPANIEGAGEVNMMSLVQTALRSRPDIIIVGEVRGKEAYAMIQAMNTGHLGSMTTLHANNTAQAMERLIAMVASAQEYPKDLVPSLIAESVDLVIHIMRFPDGKRRVVEISEVVGERNQKIITNLLVKFKVDEFKDKEIIGHWEETGNKFTKRELLKERGVDFDSFL
ncbi:MAG: CpaF family protein [Thermovenabulum sp.]|uniref:CpaF family protein n=1 Tax=Thermovenabulum sp. TaxID=3100335 RepID=UPI003C7B6C77